VRNTGRAIPLREARGRRHPVLDQPLEELAQRWQGREQCLEGLPVNGEQVDRRHAAGGRRARVASIALVALMNIAGIWVPRRGAASSTGPPDVSRGAISVAPPGPLAVSSGRCRLTAVR
jgi:hypothetical protein